MTAFDTYAKTLPRSSPTSKPSSSLVSPRREQSSLGLKYDAYPTAGFSGGKAERSRRKEKVEGERRLEGSLGLLSLHEEQVRPNSTFRCPSPIFGFDLTLCAPAESSDSTEGGLCTLQGRRGSTWPFLLIVDESLLTDLFTAVLFAGRGYVVAFPVVPC